MSEFQSMGEQYSGCYVSVNSNGDVSLNNNGYMATFGERVRERRLELGMKQPQLAKAAGIKQPTISNIESGRNKGSVYVAQLAVALQCSAHWLATGKGLKKPGGSPEATTHEQMSAREEIVLHLFAGLFSHQQRALIGEMHALFEANQITRKELGQKALRGVSDAQIESSFGMVPAGRHQPKKKPKPRREAGTAMDDFLGEPE